MKNKRLLEKHFKRFKIKLFKIIILNLALIFSASIAMAQVTGTVTFTDGTSVPGASIVVKGTTIGTITDLNGKYEITVPENSVLIFSYIGMKTQEITVGTSSIINVVLEEEIFGFDEIVVIGYGTMKKSDISGAISKVKGQTISQRSVTQSPVDLLQGRVAGVYVQSESGSPGSAVNVRVRGVGTIGDNDPLYIIDGLPGSLYFINPDDIESIEVLKDAAAAIYGSEAANGVIIITTKSGKKGESKIEYSMKFGIRQSINKLDFLNAEDYINVATAAHNNTNTTLPAYLNNPGTYNTDWQDAVTRDAFQQEHNIRISGGTENITYSLSGQTLDADGTLIGDGYSKNGLRGKISAKKGKLKITSNTSYTEDKELNLPYRMQDVYGLIPLFPIYDDSQPYGYGISDVTLEMPDDYNPVAIEHYETAWETAQYFSTIFSAEYDIFESLKYKFDYGLQNSNILNFEHSPVYISNNKDPQLYPYVTNERSNWREWNYNNILTYSKEFNKHSITVMAAYTRKKQTETSTNAYAYGYGVEREVIAGDIVSTNVYEGYYNDPNFKTLDAFKNGTENEVGGTERIYTRTSTLGRINYSFDKKYTLMATLRRDGSSRFGPDNRYGLFPSVSGAWSVSNETFMSGINNILSNLKLRASWGKMGNEITLKDYYWQANLWNSTVEYNEGNHPGIWEDNPLYYYVLGTGETAMEGLIARQLENKHLQWETTTTTNIGLDFSLFNGKIYSSIDAYSRYTSDMIVRKALSPASGMENPYVNVGDVSNIGLEIELGYKNNMGDFKYDVFGTFGFNKNEVEKLANDDQSLPGDGMNYGAHIANQTKVGHEIGAFYLYQTNGIFQSQDEVDAYNSNELYSGSLLPNAAPGDIRFVDVNSDGILNEKDMIYSGSGIPRYNYSMNIELQYRSFDCNIFMIGMAGFKIYNGNRFYFESMSNSSNYLSSTLDAWSTTNTNTDIPRPAIGDPNGNASKPSTRFLENGNFLRLKTVQLGYSLPQNISSKIKIDKLRIYVSGENLLTFTNYSGLDPENGLGYGATLTPGLDSMPYPLVRMFNLGLQLSF